MVFDTNVFVSYFWSSNETSAVKVVVRQILENKVIAVFSDEVMAEYREVLGRKKFHFQEDVVFSFLELIIQIGKQVSPAPTAVAFTDASDKPFYDAAVAAGAWLVTGNKRHYPEEPFIVSTSSGWGCSGGLAASV